MDAIRNYETLFLVKPDLTEAKLTELHKKNEQIIQAHKGKVFNLDNWGKRRLAYSIEKETRGNYFHLMFSGNNDCVAEIERTMRISDDVLRFISVRLEQDADPIKLLADFKNRLAAHAKREAERAEREAAMRAERRSRTERGPEESHDMGEKDAQMGEEE